MVMVTVGSGNGVPAVLTLPLSPGDALGFGVAEGLGVGDCLGVGVGFTECSDCAALGLSMVGLGVAAATGVDSAVGVTCAGGAPVASELL